MNVKVFKFGGASVKDAPAIENLFQILRRYPDQKLVVVISAMGKTTNFLEKVLLTYREGKEDVMTLVDELQAMHEKVAVQLIPDPGMVIDQLRKLITQLRDRLSCEPSNNYDFDYDQIVSFGELLSTTLISGYLNYAGVNNVWMDARKLIRTDDTYREGTIDWTVSGEQICKRVGDGLQQQDVVLTQGFIGGTAENLTTTLGREGSDFSAAIIAYSMGAESVTIWKDVPGLLNADPKRFSDAVLLKQIPYEEAVELAYYGASIIHPKTLKPLQNKQIPLFVKSFFNPEAEGSSIMACNASNDVPSYIVKDNQILITIFPKDFSFIAVDNLSEIFAVLSQYRVKINLMQNSALSFSVCTDAIPERTMACIEALKDKYRVKYNEDIQLVTIRHYTEESINKILNDRIPLIQQNSRTTVQMALKNNGSL